MIKSICIVRLSALGDVLMLVPLIRTLQAYFPQAKLTWVISRPAYDLVENMDGVEFVVISKPNTIRDYWQFAQRMRHHHFDVLLATQASFRANLLYAAIKAHRKIGFDRLRAKDGHGWFVRERIQPGRDHTLESFLKFAQVLGVEKPIIRWDLPSCIHAEQFAKQHMPAKQAPVVIINPAASKPERSWLTTRYIEIIQYLQQRWQAQVILMGGPSEYERQLGEVISQEVSVHNLIGQTKPKQYLACIRAAHLMICPDTGPSHMAAAVNVPVIALHAVTGAHISGPYTFRHWVVDCYPQAVEKILKKTWDTHVWGTHAHGTEAMTYITVTAVKQRIDEVMPQILP